MKTSFALFVALIAACVSIGFAQPALPEIIILATRKHCGPQRFLADVRCGCFFASQDSSVTFTNALKTECESTGKGSIASFESTCDLYLNKDKSRIRRRAVLRRLEILKTQCIRGRRVVFARSETPSNFEILADGRNIVNLLNNVCALYGQAPAIFP